MSNSSLDDAGARRSAAAATTKPTRARAATRVSRRSGSSSTTSSRTRFVALPFAFRLVRLHPRASLRRARSSLRAYSPGGAGSQRSAGPLRAAPVAADDLVDAFAETTQGRAAAGDRRGALTATARRMRAAPPRLRGWGPARGPSTGDVSPRPIVRRAHVEAARKRLAEGSQCRTRRVLPERCWRGRSSDRFLLGG